MNKILKFGIVAILTSFGSLQAAEFEGNMELSKMLERDRNIWLRRAMSMLAQFLLLFF